MKCVNIKGYLFDLEEPCVMGILNMTPDSFYPGSRIQRQEQMERRIAQILDEGGKIIDVGGYSSRPNAADIDVGEEKRRLKPALELLKTYFPDAIVSVDTFRSEVAHWAVDEYDVAIINDISGGSLDGRMFETVARLQVPYIMSHMRGTPQTMQNETNYSDMMEEIMLYFAGKLQALHLLGVNDVVIDPGFGFGKTLDQNYELMRQIRQFAMLDCPIMVGVSRKSMIYRFLECDIEDTLNATTVLHTFALLNGVSLLRVHDVKPAVEAIKIINKLKNS